MKANSYFKIFTPKNNSFFTLFENNASNLVKATILLKELMSSTDLVEYDVFHKNIQDIEHKGDDITRETYELLNKSFITPFDRKDIHELTAHIEEAVDSINGISRRVCLYRPNELLPVYGELAELICEAAKEIEKAVHCLRNPDSCRKVIKDAFGKVKDIEGKADDIYFTGASELFEKEEDTFELLKANKILEIMERCINEEEDVTDVLKTILVKII